MGLAGDGISTSVPAFTYANDLLLPNSLWIRTEVLVPISVGIGDPDLVVILSVDVATGRWQSTCPGKRDGHIARSSVVFPSSGRAILLPLVEMEWPPVKSV
jgi:hypothetical protein